MFKTRRTKIVSLPTTEETKVLEVPEPVLQEVAGLSRVVVLGHVHEMYHGVIVDYNGNTYDFQWDNAEKRIARLLGHSVNTIVWGLSQRLLENTFVVPQPVPVNPLEDLVKNGFSSVNRSLEEVKQELDSAKRELEQSRQVARIEPIREMIQSVQAVQEQAHGYEEEDLDLSTNALKFLQDSSYNPLDVDYINM